MKFIKFHKNIMAVVTGLLILVIVIFAVTEIMYNRKKEDKKIRKCDIAVLTYDDIDKDYFSQVRRGVVSAAKEQNLTYHIFSVDDYGDSYEDTLKKVLERKPVLVVMPDATFAETLYNYQHQYENTEFVLVGAVPRNADNTDSEIGKNVISVTFDDAECGFTAGYTAVQNGYDKLAFVCDDDDSRSVHYYYGYLQGADYAASLEQNRKVSVSVYHNLETEENSSVKTIDPSTEVITTSSDKIIKKLADDTELQKIPVIYLGDNTLNYKNISAMINNDIELSVKNVIISVKRQDVDTGNEITNDVTNNTIVLNKIGKVFEDIDDKEINELVSKMKHKEITVIGDTSISIGELDLNHITYTDNKVIR